MMTYPALSKGCYGSYVKYAQELLMGAGFMLQNFGPDGKFGEETSSQISMFQKRHRLNPTGEVDQATWDELLKYDTFKLG